MCNSVIFLIFINFMFNILFNLFIFLLVLFLYLHIQYHLKTSNDLEIYEIENVYKDKIEEICDLRQPTIFDIDNKKIIDSTSKNNLLKTYPVFEIKIRNVKENNENDETYMPLTFNDASQLFDNDKDGKYISENNLDFLQETGSIKNISFNDQIFRPYFVSNCSYDILCGSENSITPFRYDINYRNFFIVTQGSVSVKLTPYYFSKYLYVENDYELFEFRSPINPWNVQSKYSNDFDKVKCLEIVLLPGKCIYIPAYWFYSFKFGKNTSLTCLKYRTYFNNIAIIPKISMSFLQNQNIIRNYVKKVYNNENISNDNIENNVINVINDHKDNNENE